MQKTHTIFLMLAFAGASLAYAADHRKESPAHRAAQKNDVATLRALVAQNPNMLLEQEECGHTPLICALKKNSFGAARFILGVEEGKETVNTRSRKGKAPLAYAYKKTARTEESLALAKQLILAGANADEASIVRLTHGDPHAQIILLKAYCQRERLDKRRLWERLRCAEEMLAQERERYQLAAGVFCEQECRGATLYKANKILGTQLLESQRKLTVANCTINAYEAEKQSFEQEKSELQQKLSESQDSLERTQADLAAAELKSDDEDERHQLADENAALRAALETERRVTSTLEVVLPEVAEGWEFVLDGSPVEE